MLSNSFSYYSRFLHTLIHKYYKPSNFSEYTKKRTMSGGECTQFPQVSEEWPIIVTHVEGKGRGCIAKRDIFAGEVIALEAPLSIVRTADHTTEALSEEFCSRCLASFSKMDPLRTACSVCNTQSYCSVACQEASRVELHSHAVCKSICALQAYTQGAAPDVIEGAQLLIQLHHLKRGEAQPYSAKADAGASFSSAEEAYRQVLNLSYSAAHLTEAHHTLHSNAYALYKQCALADSFPEELGRALLQRDMQNGLSMSYIKRGSNEMVIRGSCLLGMVSMLNHSCYPNAARIDYVDTPGCEALAGRPCCSTMVRAIQSIPEGTEVCISYTPVSLPSGERKQHLKDTYGIACSCARCRIEDIMEEQQEDEEEEDCETDEDGHGHGHDHGEDCHHDHGEGMGEGDACDEDDGEIPPIALYNVFVARFICPQPGCTGTLVPIRDTIDGVRRCGLGDYPGQVRSGMKHRIGLVDIGIERVASVMSRKV